MRGREKGGRERERERGRKEERGREGEREREGGREGGREGEIDRGRNSHDKNILYKTVSKFIGANSLESASTKMGAVLMC